MSIPFDPKAHFKAMTYTGQGKETVIGNIFGTNPNPSFDVARSLRFSASKTSVLSKVIGSAGNQTTWSFSTWVRRSVLGTPQAIFGAYITAGTTEHRIEFSPTNTLRIFGSAIAETSAQFTNTDKYYHILVVFDTLNSPTVKIYVDGVSQTLSTNGFTTSATSVINSARTHAVGKWSAMAGGYLEGYLAETYFVDGQALTPSAFGQQDTLYDRWVPKAYSGSALTGNSFYFTYSNNSSVSALGTDSSGLGNSYTPGGTLSVTTDTDSMLDSPTCLYATLTDQDTQGYSFTARNGGLGVDAYGYCTPQSSLPFSSGKYYAEITFITESHSSATPVVIGIKNINANGKVNNTPYAELWYCSNAANPYYHNTAGTNTASSTTTFSVTYGDRVGIAIDADLGKMWFRKNGTWYGDPVAGTGAAFNNLGGKLLAFFVGGGAEGGSAYSRYTMNFGQQPFTDSLPTGYSAVTSKVLPYNINAPWYDLTIIKDRTTTNAWQVADSVRGLDLCCQLNAATAEASSPNKVISAVKGGFKIGPDASVNTAGNKYVMYGFKAGGAPVANNQGSIPTQVSVNKTSGFGVMTYTGTGANATLGHGLSTTPSFIITKCRNASTDGFIGWHSGLTSPQYLIFTSPGLGSSSTVWNGTPDNTIINVGTATGTNAAGVNYVSYYWTEVPGFSKIGTYTGNALPEGTFVYCGFKPALILTKDTAGTSNFFVFDSARESINPVGLALFPNTAGGDAGTYPIDFLSTGFKHRFSSGDPNGSGKTELFVAFAEIPEGLGNLMYGPALAR